MISLWRNRTDQDRLVHGRRYVLGGLGLLYLGEEFQPRHRKAHKKIRWFLRPIFELSFFRQQIGRSEQSIYENQNPCYKLSSRPDSALVSARDLRRRRMRMRLNLSLALGRREYNLK